jgi:hypothetical protein
MPREGPGPAAFETNGTKKMLFLKTNRRSSLNTAKDYMNSQKQTQKQSGEVVENTFLWKKQS